MIQIDPTKLDMFRLQDNHYIGLQAFVSIEALVQLATILGGVNVAPIDVVADVLPNGGENDGTNSEIDQYATTSDIDSYLTTM
jgi:hypothetical protein